MTKMIPIIMAGALCLGASLASAKTLTYGTYLSATHNVNTQALEPYFKTISEETDGSLKFRMFTDSTVVGGSNALKGVRGGVVDMGFIVPAYTPAQLPATATFSQLAMFTTTSLAGTAASTEMVMLDCDQCKAEWDKLGIQPLSFYSTAPYYLMCAKKKVKSIDSLKGLRIRGTGPWPDWIAAVDAVPVSLAGGETYAALNRGTVDCTAGPLAWLTTYGIMDIVNYIMDMPIGAYRPLGFLNIRSDKWQGLTDTERAAMVDNLAEATASAAWSYKMESVTTAKKAREKGIEFVEPDPEIREQYDEFLKTERDRYLRVAKERGIKNAEQLLDRYLEISDKWNKIVADIDTKDEFKDALEKRIFSKIQY